MPPVQAIRKSAKWFFIAIGVLAVLAFAISLSQQPERSEQLRAECRAKYAAARTRGDTILAENWIPAPGLQTGRSLRHCRDLAPTGHFP